MTRLIDRLGCIQSLQQRWSGFFWGASAVQAAGAQVEYAHRFPRARFVKKRSPEGRGGHGHSTLDD